MTITGRVREIIIEEISDNRPRLREIGLLFEQEHLRRFLSHFNVNCVFDVGANAGQYATMLRQDKGQTAP
jgi:hypothetical protein